MPVTPRPLASAMTVPTRQVTLPTSAGRSVRFASGIATIRDTTDLPYLFARSDLKVMVTPYAMSWMGDVLRKTRKINADVHWPEGYVVSHTSETEFDIISPDPTPSEDRPLGDEQAGEDPLEEAPTEGPPEEPPTADPIEAALKGKTRWRKPPSN